jgi:hypothetical protein
MFNEFIEIYREFRVKYLIWLYWFTGTKTFYVFLYVFFLFFWSSASYGMCVVLDNGFFLLSGKHFYNPVFYFLWFTFLLLVFDISRYSLYNKKKEC